MYIDDQEVQQLYLMGLSDGEIAERTGHHIKSIARWRRRYGYKSNRGQGKRGPGKRKENFDMALSHDFDEERALHLWEDCLTDAEIGKELGVPAMTISMWRGREGLENNAELSKWMKKQKASA